MVRTHIACDDGVVVYKAAQCQQQSPADGQAAPQSSPVLSANPATPSAERAGYRSVEALACPVSSPTHRESHQELHAIQSRVDSGWRARTHRVVEVENRRALRRVPCLRPVFHRIVANRQHHIRVRQKLIAGLVAEQSNAAEEERSQIARDRTPRPGTCPPPASGTRAAVALTRCRHMGFSRSHAQLARRGIAPL